MAKTDFKDIDQYIKTFPGAVQKDLEKIRNAIRQAIPDAEEIISYQIPAYTYGGGPAIYFSAFTDHYSLAFPPDLGVFEEFADALKNYTLSKSVVQLPKSEALPLDLIKKMAKFAAERRAAKAKK
jgi:uncharacterized protein YdhG (YjbR/CyaY superfamily)